MRALSVAGTLGAAESVSIKFRDVTEAAGLIEPLAGMMGHGGAWGDFDGDGQIDLYVGGFCDRPNSEYQPALGPVPNRLLRNLGNGRFSSTPQSAVEFYGRTSGAVFADLDNNGTLELYVANNAQGQSRRSEQPQRSAQLRPSQLFRNDTGQFVDISAESGACPPALRTARNIGVFDYDADGLLDLFVVEDRFTRGGYRSVLFRNMGGLHFNDVNHDVGLPDELFGFGLAVADLNHDGRPDFFVGFSNRLFLSQPNNRYREALELQATFAHHPTDGEDWACGAAFGDLNRDGLLDLVVTAHSQLARNRVFLNVGSRDGMPRFREVTKEVGLSDVVPVKCPHVEIQDFDNDGWPDIYISAAWRDESADHEITGRGEPGENVRAPLHGRITPLILRNTGLRDGLPHFIAPRPIKGAMVYFPAGPSGDFDNDGRLDLFLINWFSDNHSRLLHNESPPRLWLQVQVVGRKFNRMGMGAQIRVSKAEDGAIPSRLLGFQEVSTGYGYASGQPALCHFGLGDEALVDVEVKLPNGTMIRRSKVKANQRLTVEEP